MLRSIEILGIILFRFRPLPRLWAFALIIVNCGSFFFLDTHYGLYNLLAVVAGIIVMSIIYSKLGFVRLLGIGHIFWIPMLIWFVIEPPSQEQDSLLFYWVISLIVFNIISLVIDSIDVIKFLSGDRKPYYEW